MMLYKNTKVKVHSLDGHKDFFDIVTGAIYQPPCLGMVMTQGKLFFKQSLAGLNSEFSSPRLVAPPRLKKPVSPNIYP